MINTDRNIHIYVFKIEQNSKQYARKKLIALKSHNVIRYPISYG